MMRAVLVVAGMAAPAVAHASEATAFVQELYGHYRANGSGTDWNGARASRIFDADLTALIRKDASGDGVGLIDADPICDCQDYDIKHVSVQEQAAAQDRVAARVSFENMGQPTSMTLLLHRTRSGWRIADIRSARRASLVEYLRKELGTE